MEVRRLGGAALAALALAGCAGGSTGSPAPSSLASPMPMATPFSTYVATATSMPVLVMPTGMPVPAGAVGVGPPVGGGALEAWTVDADPPDVYDFFVRELAAAGFSVDGAFPGGDAAIIRFSSADGTGYQLDLTGHDPVRVTLGVPHD